MSKSPEPAVHAPLPSNGAMIENLAIVYCDEKRYVTAPVGLTVDDLISWSLEELDLPTENGAGHTVSYKIILRRTEQTLVESNTLAENQVQENDELELVARCVVMPPTPAASVESLTPTSISSSAASSRLHVGQEWPAVVDKNLRRAIQVIDESQKRKNKTEVELIGIDKSILLVFSIALLGALFFSFYLIAVDKLNPVTNVLYPIIALILGFMSGYFAGTGRTKGRA